MQRSKVDKEARIQELLERNVDTVVEKEHLGAALRSGKKLRVKLGIDPTSSDLHLGHAVVLGKLKQFQDLGHKAILIIGDFTGRIGDPSGRSDARKPLTEKQVRDNMKKYLVQAGKVIDVKKAEVRHNNDWFSKGGMALAIQLASTGSIQQVLRRADFKKRISEDRDITLLETLYPILQGYDSVAVKADVELGGTDQTFNVLMGRRVQRHFGMKEQDVMTVPLLEGLDGVKKMSKSIGNYIGLGENPADMFGKIMSIPDALIERYFILCTDISGEEIKSVQTSIAPRDQKMRLGFEVVKRYHGEKKAATAKEEFVKTFSKKEAPTNIPEIKVRGGSSAVDVVTASGVVKSKGEAWRLVTQGGFKVNDIPETDPRKVLSVKSGDVLKIGKRHFFKVKI